MSIQQWPISERPREKLINQGCTALSDAELLAIFLGSGLPGKNAVSMARELLNNSGGLRALLNLSHSNLCANKGVGSAKYAFFQAALELGRRYLMESMQKGQVIDNPQLSRDFLTLTLRDKEYESFYVLFLDAKHQIIHHDELFRGTINSASVPVREVVKEALKHNCTAMIIAHNHPSGVSTPSQADIRLTEELKNALQLLEIKLLDHFVVGETEVISLAEMGLIG